MALEDFFKEFERKETTAQEKVVGRSMPDLIEPPVQAGGLVLKRPTPPVKTGTQLRNPTLQQQFQILENEERERQDPTGMNFVKELAKRPIAGLIHTYKGLAQLQKVVSEPFEKYDINAQLRTQFADRAIEHADRWLQHPWIQAPQAWREPIEWADVEEDAHADFAKRIEQGEHPFLAQAGSWRTSLRKHAPRLAAVTAEASTSMVIAYGAGFLTGQYWLGPLILGMAEAGPLADRALEAGVDPHAAVGIGVVSTAVIAALEMLPVEMLLRYGGKRRIIAALRSGAAEMTQELLQNLYSNTVEHYGWDKSQEIWEGAFESAVSSFLLGSGAGVLAPEYQQQARKWEESREPPPIELTDVFEEPAIELDEPAFPPHPTKLVADPGLYIRARKDSPVFLSFRGASMNLEKASKEVGRPHELVQIINERNEPIGWGLWAAPPTVPEAGDVEGVEPTPEEEAAPPTIDQEIEDITDEEIDDLLEPTPEGVAPEIPPVSEPTHVQKLSQVLQEPEDAIVTRFDMYKTDPTIDINAPTSPEGELHTARADGTLVTVENATDPELEEVVRRRTQQILQIWPKLGTGIGDIPNLIRSHVSSLIRAENEIIRRRDEIEAPEPTPEVDIGTPAELNVGMLTEMFLQRLREGEVGLNKVRLQQIVAAQLGISRGDLLAAEGFLHKPIEEAFEYAVVRRAREIISDLGYPGIPAFAVYEQLKTLYETQPRLATRTGISIKTQQYSTPVHLAFLMQVMTETDGQTTVYEPTAGTGMLLTTTTPARVLANELVPTRADILRDQGFVVSQEDARGRIINSPSEGRMDVMLANPPFGSQLAVDVEGVKVMKLEHEIVMDALLAMKDDGKAAFLIGEHTIKEGQTEPTRARKNFLNWLYSNYNVIANIEIPGSEYARQGTVFNVTLHVVDGRLAEVNPTLGWWTAHDQRLQVESIDELAPIAEEIGRGTEPEPRDILAPEGVEEVPPSGEVVGPPVAPEPEGVEEELPPAPPPEIPEPTPEAEPGVGPPPPVGEPTPEPIPGPIPPGVEPEPVGPPGEPGELPPGVVPPTVPPEPVPEPEVEPERPEREPGPPEPEPTPEPEPVEVGPPEIEPVGVPGVESPIEQDIRTVTDEDLDDMFGEPDGRPEIPLPPEQEEVPPDRPDEVNETLKGSDLNQRWDEYFEQVATFWTGRPGPEPIVEEIKPLGAGESLLDAIEETGKAGKELVKGLDTLFGGKDPSRVSMGFTFDEETYAQAKPHFDKALKHALQAGQSLRQMVDQLIAKYGDVIKPYLRRWIEEGRERKKIQKIREDEYQVTYIPKSRGQIIDETMMPRMQRQAVNQALDNLEERIGDIDEFVARELRFPTVEELWNKPDGTSRFSADQVDALALALDNLKNGKAMIVGDATGVGKGRVAAAIMDWARWHGHIPIFFTEKATLFTDIYRDMVDIGRDFNPFIMGDRQKGTIFDKEGKIIYQPLPDGKRRAFLERLAEAGTQAEAQEILRDAGYDMIVTTYSQINKPDNLQQQVIAKLSPGNFMILDEAHNAAGDSNTGAYMRDTLERVEGVIYLSATFAKRPDTLSLYRKTDISKANMTHEELVSALTSGGTPLQEILSTAWTKQGQYIRREKSFRGISMPVLLDTKNKARDEERSDTMTFHLRGMIRFDNRMAALFAHWNGLLKTALRRGKNDWLSYIRDPDLLHFINVTGLDPSWDIRSGRFVASSVSKTTFAAKVHNAVRQLLFAINTDWSIENTKAALAEGKKPFVAVSNTMGTFFKEMVDEGEIKEGDPFKFSYNDSLRIHMNRMLQIRYTDTRGNSEVIHFDIDALPADFERDFNAMQERIAESFTDLPLSPIDEMREQLSKVDTVDLRTGKTRKVVVEEITDRDFRVDITDPDNPKLILRRGTEKSRRNQVIRDYNNGKIDVIIVNAAGAAGLSAHASPEFKDQRIRKFVGAQADLDVAVEVQKMGRIHRKGQVVIPEYVTLAADLPANNRPISILMRKLKSLSANTSANTDSVLMTKEIPDMMNKYGDEVVQRYLHDNPEIASILGQTVSTEQLETAPPAGFMGKITGKVALLPVAQQKSFYEEVESAYNEKIQDLKDEGTYDLEVEDLDFNAETLTTDLLVKGTDEENPFGESTFIEKLKVKSLRKPYRRNQLAQYIFDKAGKTEWLGKYDEAEMNAFIRNEGRAYVVEKISGIVNDARAYIEQKRSEAEEAGEEFDVRNHEERIEALLAETSGMALGHSYRLTFPGDARLSGILIDVTHAGGDGNPANASKTKLIFAVNSPMQRYILPTSRIGIGDRAVRLASVSSWWGRWNQLLPTEATEERWMVTGNLLQGFTKAPTSSKVVRFTDHKGELREGILTPATFDAETNPETQRVTVTPEQAAKLVKENKPLRGNVVNILSTRGAIGKRTRIPIRTDSRKKQGSPYYTDDLLRGLLVEDDFEKRGKKMWGNIPFENIETFVNRVYAIGDRFSIDRAVFNEVFRPREEKQASDEAILELRNEITPEIAMRLEEQDRIATWDLAQGPTAETKAPDIARRGDAIRAISKKLNVPIKAGKFRGRKILGIWKFGHGEKVIRTRRANDFPTVIHEVAHDIEQLLYPGAVSHLPEVRALAYPGARSKNREGFAEFVRYFVTQPDFARSEAPLFYTEFEEKLFQNPDVQEVIVMARQTWQAWKQLAPVQKVDSILHERPQKKIEIPTLNQLYTYIWDQIHPLRKIGERYKKLKGTSPLLKDDPFYIAWLNRGWPRIAEQFIKWGTFQYSEAEGANFTGPSYHDILFDHEQAGERRLIDIYTIAKRAIADPRVRRGFEPDFTMDDWQAIVDELGPRFEETTQKLQFYSEQLMEFITKAGVISPEVKRMILEKNLQYTPLHRVMDTGEQMSGGLGRKFGNIPSPIYTLKGSARDVYSPTESLIYNTYALINAAMRNRVGMAMYKLTQEVGLGDMLKVYQLEGMAELAEKVPFKIKPIKMTTDEALRAIANNLDVSYKELLEELEANFGLDEENLEELITTFRPLYRAGPNEAIFKINGQPLLFEMAPDIYSAIMATDATNVHLLVKALSIPASLLRAGATLAPEFATRNPFRDQFTAWLWSKYKWLPTTQMYDFGVGVANIWNKTELWQKFNASGAAHAAAVSLDRKYGPEQAKKLLKQKGFTDYVRHPIETLRLFSELTEEATRVGEFIRAYKAEGGDLNAMFTGGVEGRDITLDFQRIGAMTKSLNMVTAFWNANAQGPEKWAREMKRQPVRVLTKAFLGITLPTLLLWWAQKDDPDYQELPEWRKMLFWNFITRNPDGTLKRVWSFPKPFDVGIFFGSFFEGFAEYVYHDDPEQMSAASEELFDSLTPNPLPTAMVPIWEWFTNKSIFFERPIIPRSTEELEPLLQFQPYTSETAKIIAKAMDQIPYVRGAASPGKIENLIRGWTGGLGGHGLERLDQLMDVLGIVDRPIRPYEDWTNWPILRGFRQRMPTAQSRSIQQFYDKYHERRRAWESKKERAGMRGKGFRIERPPELVEDEKVAKELSFLRRVVQAAWDDRTLTPHQKRRAIDSVYQDMINIARRRLGKDLWYMGIDRAVSEGN